MRVMTFMLLEGTGRCWFVISPTTYSCSLHIVLSPAQWTSTPPPTPSPRDLCLLQPVEPWVHT